MKKKLPLYLFRLFLPAGFLFLFSGGCASEPEPETVQVSGEKAVEPKERSRIITDYRGRENGASVPPWLDAFLLGGNRGVEALEEYRDRFVFVALNSGANFNALTQWLESFSAELDFPRLAAVRMERRFLSSLTGYPDDEYGAYFETMIRNASDFFWKGAVRVDDFWIRRQFAGAETEDGGAPETGPAPEEAYEVFVLLTIEKPLLSSQIEALLLNVKPVPPLTRDQSAAVNRVRESFYDSF